ncbi:hypothetical protein KVR01_006664 [Diaporthe batatas]|uniref:uncharacterized protein n=1 Tax=Diaporthe batatas TaxID=748121 RepID=UPI001D0419F9|nr:uncharacterized protein KVR01_006664 [Diaporthe batatas]KAG8163367.1 hypothetical protein KVR01_006664 [Diaporthe batatas]
MPGKTMELLRHLIGMLSASFEIACALLYYAYAAIIYGTGAAVLVLGWCAICGLSQSIAERVPVKRWIDRRLQEEFLRKVRNAGFQELNMRARLINAGEDVKMRNWDNGRILGEICDAEDFIMGKVRHYTPHVSGHRYDIHPVIPGMFIPPHPTPTAPSSYAIVRWWFSQDHELHQLECSIAGFSVQLEENRRRLEVLRRENESLRQELGQALERKHKVRHRPTLPNYKQMYQNFDAALETLRHGLPLHHLHNECKCAHEVARSYPEWLVPPPKPLRWWEWGLLAPGQPPPRTTSLSAFGDLSAPARALTHSPHNTAVFAGRASIPALPLPPLFGTPPHVGSIAMPERLLHSAGPPHAALTTPATPPSSPIKSLSLADRLRDPTGLRARPPTPSPPASPRHSHS